MKRIILLALAIASTATASAKMRVVNTTEDGVITLQSERGDLFEIVDDHYTTGNTVNVVMFTAWTASTQDDVVVYTSR